MILQNTESERFQGRWDLGVDLEHFTVGARSWVPLKQAMPICRLQQNPPHYELKNGSCGSTHFLKTIILCLPGHHNYKSISFPRTGRDHVSFIHPYIPTAWHNSENWWVVNAYFIPSSVLSALSSCILITLIKVRFYHYIHFTEEESHWGWFALFT